MTSKLFDRTIGLLQRTLDLTTSRHKLLSTNIANSETPHYLPIDIPFQKVLERSIHHTSPVSLMKTHPDHLPAHMDKRLEIEASTEGMEIDQEMAKLAENNLMFQAGVQALLKKLEALKVTIQEGGR